MRRIVKYVMAGFVIWVVVLPIAMGAGFQPVVPEELKMTSEPLAPGAPAIILYRQVDRDDNGRTSHEENYVRIKILTEEGRKHADVEIPFLRGQNDVVNVHARTISPDGSIAEFEGKVFEKTLVKGRGFKYLAKTFTLPNVQVGSIIEYSFTYDYKELVLYDSHWILSQELFTKAAKFSLKRYTVSAYSSYLPFSIRWTWQGLPPGTGQPVGGPDNIIRLDVHNIPAFPVEDFMPPENELKARVDFIYSLETFESDPAKYWKKFGKKRNDELETFIGKRKAMEGAVAGIVAPGDAPEIKVAKIYSRVQQLRNVSFEQEKTEQEQKREKEKPLNNVEEVWKKQSGNGEQLTWLFLALVRAAGVEAYGMWVPDRNNYFFNPQAMDSQRLDANLVVVKLNGKDVFCDPGAAFQPFGMLPWSETGVTGLKLDKEGGSWVKTSMPESSESRIQRKAELRLTETGDLEGKLSVTFTGLELSARRVEMRWADAAERKKFLEDEVKESIPAGCEVELTNQPDWKSSSPSMVAEFTMKVPGWVSGAGRRAMMPVGVFSAPEKHMFDHAERVHPVYFKFPFQRVDDVYIDLPLGWQVSVLPPPQKRDAHAVLYTSMAENNKGTLHLNRVLTVDVVMLEQKYYSTLRTVFQGVRTADEQQAILQPAGVGGGN